MKKITDERLKLRNLQNLRVAFVVQTIGIFAILAYEFFQGGMDGMRNNPLWLVFMITAVVLAYLSMTISVEHETPVKNSKKSFYIGIIVVTIISLVVGVLTYRTPGSSLFGAILVGFVIFVCAFIPVIYVYRIRKKFEEDWEDE